MEDKYRASTEAAHLEQLEERRALDEEGVPCRLMAIGDSHFERMRWNPEMKDYYELLKKQNVCILAKGGDRIEHLSWRLSHQTLDPTLFPFAGLKGIALLIGCNNLVDRPTKRMTIPAKIRQIISRLQARFTVPIYLFTLPYSPHSYDQGWNESIDIINQNIRDMDGDEGIKGIKGVKVIDPWEATNADAAKAMAVPPADRPPLESGAGSMYFEDHCHFNHDGYRFLVDQIQALLNLENHS